MYRVFIIKVAIVKFSKLGTIGQKNLQFNLNIREIMGFRFTK